MQHLAELTPLQILDAFANLLVNGGRLALVVIAVYGAMRMTGWAMQSRARRHAIEATRRGYAALAGRKQRRAA